MKIGHNRIEMVGQRHGRLVVKSFSKPDARREANWLCLCDCGKETIVSGYYLRSGHTKSCGCLVIDVITKHGHSKEPEYAVWYSLVKRCTDPKSHAYENYGGRGITVCKRWLEYENFIKDMGYRPSAKHSIERVKNNKGYSKSNCKWATSKEQMNNTRWNRILRYNGVSMNISQWAEKINIKRATVDSRIAKGWSIEKILTTPLRSNKLK